MSTEIAERMMALFPCDTRSYAWPRYNTAKPRAADGKIEVVYKTERKPVTIEAWKQHIAGKRQLTLGLLNEDGVTSVSCLDVDDYGISPVELAGRISERKLPLVVALSKSGGAHVFAFHDQPIPHAEHLSFAQGVAGTLGLADKKVEFFPKPPSGDPKKLVKGLNMPHFGSDGPGIKRTGAHMLIGEFLSFAESNRITAEQRAKLAATKKPKPAQSQNRDGKLAEQMLKRFCAELSAAPLGTRNELLYGRGKDVGKLIPKYIEREIAERDMMAAIAHWEDQPKCKDTLTNGINDGMRDPHDLVPENCVSRSDHVARARHFRELRRPHLLHYRDDFLDFGSGAYFIVEDGVISADTWTFLDKATTIRGKDGDLGPFLPDRASVGETLAALKAVTHLDPGISAPCWLDGRNGPPPGQLIAFPNGMLDVRDDKLHPPDPLFFTTAALGFNYVSEAPDPKNWKQFLREIYHDDEQEIAAVQETFGYLLTADVSHEKAFLFLGPKRSGKGTMLRMMQHLLAPTSVAGPSLKSLATNFGLAPLIGKQLAIIDDLRIGSPKDTDVLVENLLKITGRGFFTIDRKFKSAWSGSLPVKLVLVSNTMPKLGDDSAALANRFIISNTKVSFYDREDPLLFEHRLLPELPGVFHWSLAGLRRLRGRGRFEETETSIQAKDRLAHLGSPVMGFVAERCVLHPDRSVPKDVIYAHWVTYAADNGLFKLNKEHFFEALYAATGDKVHGGKKRADGGRVPTCFGIDMIRPDPRPEEERFI